MSIHETTQVTAEDFFAHIYGDTRGWLVAFTGRQARLDNPGARSNELEDVSTRPFRYPEQAGEAADFLRAEAEAERDAYQGVHLYKTNAGRKGENALEEVASLWLDEDEGTYPEDGPAPTAVLHSSSDRRHLYWKLTRCIPIDEAVSLCKRIAIWSGGDRGKAGRATVLRTPGTANYKRTPKVDLVAAELTGVEAYDPETLDEILPPLPAGAAPSDETECPVTLNPYERRVWEGEDPARKADGTVDRSGTLWKIAGTLHDAGATRVSIARALNERDESLGYRKYTNRPDQYDKIAAEYQGRPRNPRVRVTGTATDKTYELTDTGNAERFADQHGRNVKWVSKWHKHLIWTGRVWSIDEREDVSRKAQITAKSTYADAMRPGASADEQKAISRHAIASQNGPKIRAMIELAHPHMAASHTDFDSDVWLLNCQNGTIDLRTGERREHRRDDLITKVTPVEYDPAATAPTFDAFLKRILPSAELRGYVQRAFGMALAGEIRDNVLMILHGRGANGKSTLMDAVMYAFGDYAIASAPDLLMTKQGASHPTELADLFGARLVSCMESEEGRRLNEGLVKQLTGRDKVKARRMREDFWEFLPTHTVFLGTNHKPEIRGTDYAIWRRLKLVPFAVTIPDAEQDKDLPAKLAKEAPGILRWIVEGCLEWQRDGLKDPVEVTKATAGYKADMDLLEQFIEDECVQAPSAEATAAELYSKFGMWWDDTGQSTKKPNQKQFSERLREKGFEPGQVSSGPQKGRRKYVGIGLRTGQNPPDGDDSPSTGRGSLYSPSTAENPIGKAKSTPQAYDGRGRNPESGMDGSSQAHEGPNAEKPSTPSTLYPDAADGELWKTRSVPRPEDPGEEGEE